MKTLLVVLTLLSFTPAVFAEGEAFRVMDTAGRAETLDVKSGAWKPLAAGASLSPGSRVRTGPESWALFLLSSGVEEAIELAPDSAMDLPAPAAARLEKGRLYLMMEEGGPRPFFSVETPKGSIKIRTGGCLTVVSPSAVEWRVYGEEARIHASSGEFTVGEGFKLRLSKAGQTLSRMNFNEYAEWQAWTRKWYQKKDDAVYDDWEERVKP